MSHLHSIPVAVLAACPAQEMVLLHATPGRPSERACYLRQQGLTCKLGPLAGRLGPAEAHL